jgi:AraC family transcriptional regulator, regulatory protein of adaptative response / DNA-3-methyladenine glycosylase II
MMVPLRVDLDSQTCSRARLARDARFDGKFYIAVLTTGIYCRPICRSRSSKEEHVRYYPTAAAAAEAGFRPCLRCRPECSPGTPAWLGTSSTVARALRLIGESGLEEGGVEALAEHLGIGSRHLRRLFLKHLGATPTAVAQTRRLHFAKKLIDETRLPMTQVALAAGFGCVRRFNAAIQTTYHRTPTQIRSLARPSAVQLEDQYLFRLRFRPPFDWPGILAFLSPRATPGVEVVEPGFYRRSISVNGIHGSFEVSLDEPNYSLLVRVRFADPGALFFIIERIRAMFDLDADWPAIAQILRADPLLAPRLDAHPGLRVPGCWNGFELATRAILGQQITVKGATSLAGRMVQAFGQPCATGDKLTHLFPRPEVLADAALTSIGLTTARAETIRALARAVRDRHIGFERIADTPAFLEKLRAIPGIGKWTAQYVAMRALGEPDAFPSGDIALLRALDLGALRDLDPRAETWRPWRAYAVMYLWRSTVATRAEVSRAVLRSPLAVPESSTPETLPKRGKAASR